MNPIPGFEGRYSATEDGRIYSHRKGGFLSQSRTGRYASVALGTSGSHKVHKLILLAFHGPAPAGHVARHGDGNSRNNAARNLSWSTQSINVLDKNLHGTMPKGESHPMRKLTSEQVSQLRAARMEGLSFPQLGERFGISKSQAHRIVSNENWRG